MERGRIIKGIGGFYTVLLDDGGCAVCKARGRFRNDGITPMIGDTVEVRPQAGSDWALQEILPRKNELTRPPVSNIDQLVIVVAACAPKPDWLLVDKLILQSTLHHIEPVLVLNKLDACDAAIVDTFVCDYARVFATYRLSAISGEGIPALRERLRGRVSCFAGQSAVGKSSLLNALIPELALETGELAKKTDRGRHTTRHAELWPYLGGAVLDTPGFSLFETNAITQQQLDAAYPEFLGAPERCRFASCSHVSEPECAVKALLTSGQLSSGRYARYIEIHNEIEKRRTTQYD